MQLRPFIFSEALGCAPIAGPMLESYFAHHDQPLTLFLFDDDYFVNNYPSKVSVVRIGDQSESLFPSKPELKQAFQMGHSGTALLWASILDSGIADSYVHLDADNIYLGNVLDEILDRVRTFNLVGYRRPYAKAPNVLPFWQRVQMKFATDTVHTFAMGVRPLSKHLRMTRGALEKEIGGFHRFGRFGAIIPNLDFFDRTAKRLSPFAGKTHFLEEGSELKRWGLPSQRFYDHKVLSISAVGSGYAFSIRTPDGVPESYVKYALSSWALYNSLFLGMPCSIAPLDAPELVARASQIDRKTWKVTP